MSKLQTMSSDAIRGKMLIAGKAEGPLLFSDTAISFWGGVDPQTGNVIDRLHPLHGQCLAGAILAIPGGRGSCTGSAVLLQLILNDKAPAGFIFSQEEEILTLGVIVADEMYGRSLPITKLSPDAFEALRGLDRVSMRNGCVGVLNSGVCDGDAGAAPVILDLSERDRHQLSDAVPEATRTAMRIVVRMAELLGASNLIDVAQVHVDGCIYTGPASLDFARRLAQGGGRVAVPTSLNAISVDQGRWREQGTDPALAEPAGALADAYVSMGARPTFTCAPYLLDSAPSKGQDIAWAESNAVVYGNSVLGARTMKYPDFLDICIALTGRAPLAGCHLPENRKACLVVTVEAPRTIDDSFWPLLGYCVGKASPSRIPLVTGVDHLAPSPDDLKAFGAAFATTSAAPMFHILGVTPEADPAEAEPAGEALPEVIVGQEEMRAGWRMFNPDFADEVQLIALGNPHFSFDECQRLAGLIEGQACHRDVTLTVTLGRDTDRQIHDAGIAGALETFGVRIIRDACWCTVSEPIVPAGAKTILTNSGKYAHYGPGLTGKAVRFAGLEDCVRTAVSGVCSADLPDWLAGPVHRDSPRSIEQEDKINCRE